MKTKTVVVSGYPIFREGLKEVLGPTFTVTSYFDDVSTLLDTDIEAELAILDEEASKDLALLRNERPNLTILKLSLEDNTGYIYESMNGASSVTLLNTVQSLAEGISIVRCRQPERRP